ncbi:PAS domain S-box-containing protein/diguanylate cyclase (GGDEF) domain-containing protein [Thermosyntropha lipolytica DSM 11003]|uniref:PAS domain S-box-containing protein/diguanylate cyclase (GGDEF) domain-containing protein n=1 Tax=Thermosyntropha lipolytica DSM 11003 TaxID=1123382 RepID=A0A1M5LVD5_9FIRM|nr:HD domain-containing phosphohydrolase [Thermosyntropha lipolytica]SHG69028.1 PAS domain S-box-containing protein/diguanylate cyclase (GGDEF) domain-containing protein [Thermosyntropha lipolytica DSM 11003]
MKEDLCREVIEKAPFGYALHKICLDEEGRADDFVYLDVNPAFERIIGLSRESVLNRRVTQVLPGIKEDSFDWISIYGRIAREGGEEEFSRYYKPLDRWLRIKAFSPAPGFLVTLFVDINEEMAMINELARQKEEIESLNSQLKLIFESTQDALFLAKYERGNFYYLHSNPTHQRLTGYRLEDIKGKTPEEVLGEELASKVKKGYMQCIEKKAPVTYEETLLLPGGEKTWQVSLTPVCHEGEVCYIIGSRQDITLQKKQEDKLQKKLTYERIASTISRLALKEQDKDTFVNQALRIIGEGAGVSRVYLFEEDPGKNTVSNTYEWTAPGVESQQEKLQELKIDLFDWWMERIYNREVISFRSVEEIPDEFTRLFLKEQMIKSILVLPVSAEKGEVSFIGFDECLQERIWDEDEVILLSIVADIFNQYLKLRRYEEEMVYKSYHDALTGLYNRRFVEDRIKDLDIPENLPLAVLVLDVNGLKVVNDALGHAAGDKMLKAASEVIKKSCRRHDVVVRWGGDEFLVFLPLTTAEKAEEIVERISRNCEKVKDLPVKISLAAGFAVKTRKIQKIDKVLREAEEWMYRNKLLKEKSSRRAIIDTLLSTLMEKSAETREHAERMRDWGIKIAKHLRLSARELDEISLLALLHDIGKVGVKEEILKKPAPLTEDEWREMRRHPEIGCRIAQNTAELLSVADYILAHHERWDGKGYPKGLKGEEIPLLARIIAVVDAYDAMTSDRPYRKALTHEEALEEIRRNAGTQFDPRIVEIFIDIIEKEKNEDTK